MENIKCIKPLKLDKEKAIEEDKKINQADNNIQNKPFNN